MRFRRGRRRSFRRRGRGFGRRRMRRAGFRGGRLRIGHRM